MRLFSQAVIDAIIILPIMETSNLLDKVCDYLLRKGDEFELVTSPDDPSRKIGVAYIQYDSVLPASFLFTEETNPQAVVLDVLFAAKIPEDRLVEMSLMLNKLNEDQKTGTFRFDTDSGYVYFRQASVVEGMDLSDDQFRKLLSNMEQIGLDTAADYSVELEKEFPN